MDVSLREAISTTLSTLTESEPLEPLEPLEFNQTAFEEQLKDIQFLSQCGAISQRGALHYMQQLSRLWRQASQQPAQRDKLQPLCQFFFSHVLPAIVVENDPVVTSDWIVAQWFNPAQPLSEQSQDWLELFEGERNRLLLQTYQQNLLDHSVTDEFSPDFWTFSSLSAETPIP